MKTNRRTFITTALTGGMAAAWPLSFQSSKKIRGHDPATHDDYQRLHDIMEQPVFKKELFTTPVMIESIELSRYNNDYLCRVRSSDGAEGVSIGHPFHQTILEPVFHRLRSMFTGEDARDLDSLIERVYQHNYKLQGLALWIPLATIEFAILDMMGHIANKPAGMLIGEIHNTKVGVYFPNDNRGRSAKESVERIQRGIEGSNVRAIKIKVAGRMSDPEYPKGRSKELIPLVRKTFGDEIELYADANSGYTTEEAIRIGKLMEENGYGFFEEPVPYDAFEETRRVSEALSIPISGGEQDTSLHHFRWLIANNALQIVQPDQFYFGGMIRSMKVARMAEAFGKICTPHLSGGGLGYLYMMHFVSAIPNAGSYHEVYRDNTSIPVESSTSSLIPDESGSITVPTGPGLGVTIDPEFVKKFQVVQR